MPHRKDARHKKFKPRIARRVVRSFAQFFQLEASGGLFLLACAIAALLWANSPYSDSYFGTWKLYGQLSFGDFAIKESLAHWINDGLMAIFFLVVGLEIKRELMVGELSSIRLATLPIFAALGGMIVPALLYVAMNAGTPAASGWGIPMATDIAFSLGILALLGKRVPIGLKIFLTALAIVDDLGAVLVIALFYTESVRWDMLGFAGVVLALLAMLNRSGVRNLVPYILLGIPLWVLFLESGVHATIAGVLLAMTIPTRIKVDPESFLKESKNLVDEFDSSGDPGEGVLNSQRQSAVHALESLCEQVQMPLERLMHLLHPWVTFAIVPLFGLANAGVALAGTGLAALGDKVVLGIVLGLALGKPIGIGLFSLLAVKLGLAQLPQGVNWKHIWGVGCLAGIGFTMSLFIADLAFKSPEKLQSAKIGILLASLIAGVVGFTLVRAGLRRLPKPAETR